MGTAESYHQVATNEEQELNAEFAEAHGAHGEDEERAETSALAFFSVPPSTSVTFVLKPFSRAAKSYNTCAADG
jgi:hypothetical protein